MAEETERSRAGRGRASALAACALAFLLCQGCSVLKALDFGGDDQKAFEFRWGWEKGIETSKAKPGKVDEHGVYQPETPEVEAILGFPNVHAGLAWEIQPEPRMTPTVAIELCRAKFPYVRWFELQVGAGAQLAEVSLTKRLVSVFEITAGPWIGWDFEERRPAWGACFTIIKF